MIDIHSVLRLSAVFTLEKYFVYFSLNYFVGFCSKINIQCHVCCVEFIWVLCVGWSFSMIYPLERNEHCIVSSCFFTMPAWFSLVLLL